MLVIALFSGIALAGSMKAVLAPTQDGVGTPRQEKLFTKGDLGAKMLNEVTLESDGVLMTTLPNTVINIPVRYNQNDEGKINWNNGTKLVFTAKDNITGIIIDGDWTQFSEADKGDYVNGLWTGSLNVGESVTFTAGDGINVQSIIILYNGAEYEPDEVEEVEVKIDFNITKTDWSKIGNVNGETIGTVSSNTPGFDHYMFEITCDDDPSQYISFNDLLTIEGPIVCTTPETGAYDLYKGQNYTLHIYVYDSPQYGVKPLAEATYKFVGTGKWPIIYNEEIEVEKVGLKTNSQGLGYNLKGLSFDVTFTAPIATLKAWWAKGFEGSTNFQTAKKDAEGKVWTITMTESVTSAEGAVNVNLVATDAEGHQLKCACDATPYAFDIVVSPEDEPEDEPLATLTIKDEVLELSETEAIELAKYPAGAVIAINNDDAAIKKITYEIIDLNINEILKSQGELSKGEDGIWRAEMPKDYDLAEGHSYSIHVMAFNGMSSFTSKMLYEYNFLVKGTAAGLPVYSDVKVVSVTPDENEVITEAEPVITIVFTEAIKTLKVTAITGQMSSMAIPAANVTSEDNITWNVKVPASAIVDGSLSLDFVAIDNKGNRVTDSNNGVGTPETCYLQYGWLCTQSLPTPKMKEDGTSMISIEELTFVYDGIGLNQDVTTATWKDIQILKDGQPIKLDIEESQFEVKGEDAGNAMVWTLPVTLYKGVYTIKVPAMAFMLGHDQLNNYNGDCEFTVTATAEEPVVGEPEVELNIFKTDWSKIGNQNGETIGTVTLKNAEAFDHFETEIRCQEDPDQYITFANTYVNGGNLTCYAWEGGYYTLNKGYHYTITVKAFDVPYYGAAPVAVATYEFVGTGAAAVVYSDLEMVKVDLPENDLLYHGYDLKVSSFDVTFSAPVSKVKVWGAFGMDGSANYQAQKKSDDGTVWTIILSEDVLNEEGSINVMIQAWDAQGVMAKGWNGDHAFDLNLIINLTDPDAIRSLEAVAAGRPIYTLGGARVQVSQLKKGQIYIVNGKKFQVK